MNKEDFKNCKVELEGQLLFDDYIGANLIRNHNTDGFTKSVLFEMKLSLGSGYGLSKALKQRISYSDKLKTNGEYLPFYFIAVDINNTYCYVYDNNNGDKLEEFDWFDNKEKIINYINSDKVIKYYVNEDNAIGLAGKYYESNPTANKRNMFDDYLKCGTDKFYPYSGNEKDFSSIMDKLNDPSSQKVLGAFYTPDIYVKIATEYIREAISMVTTKDYVIIDRCAGSGNLEKFLTNEELSHCILNTYEAKEWIALNQNYQGLVRKIVPPYYKPNGTLLEGGNALEERFLENFKEEFRLRDSGELTIIMLENPPFSDIKGDGVKKTGTRCKDKPFMYYKIQEDKEVFSNNGSTYRELANLFIWSANTYFKPEHYILIAPIRYWKSRFLMNKHLVKGHISNRINYGATESGLPICWWSNIKENSESIILSTDDNNNYEIKKVHTAPDVLADKTIRKENESPAVFSIQSMAFHQTNGWSGDYDRINHKWRGKVYMTESNLKQQFPLWVANWFIHLHYYERDILMRSADGGDKYQSDNDFLNDCLLYALLTNKNKCTKNCKIYSFGFKQFNQKQKHNKIMEVWNKIYNNTNIYGLNNVIYEADTYKLNNKGQRIYDNPELHQWVIELKELLKQFYIDNLRNKMLEYELVK